MSGNSPSPVTASPSALAGTRPSRWRQVAIGGGGIAAVAGLLWLTSGGPPAEKEETKPAAVETAGQIGAGYDATPRPRVQPTTQQNPGPTTQTNTAPAAYVPAPLMVFGRDETGQRRATRPGDDGPQATTAEAGTDPLSRQLRAEDQPTAVATRLPDRNRFLTEGTPLACIPDAPITSDVAGAFRCKTRDAVFSTSGNVPLLDAGTWISGRVGEGLRRGQRRLFVTFTRLETPDGCTVRIRAPGADALGQAGLDGEIDRHWFERFAPYLAVAFFDTAMQAATLAAANAAGGGGSGNRLNFFQFQSGGRQGMREAFQDDFGIPPTLYRNQAEPIVVRLTQDVDMRPCYRLRTAGGVR